MMKNLQHMCMFIENTLKMNDSLGVLRISLGMLSTPEHPLITPLLFIAELHQDRLKKMMHVDLYRIGLIPVRCKSMIKSQPGFKQRANSVRI